MLPEATARSYASLTPVQPAVGKDTHVILASN